MNYISALGNAGDSVIALGVIPFLQNNPELHNRTAFRGGCFEPHEDIVKTLAGIPRSTPLVILPSTFKATTAQLLTEFQDVIVCCREPATFAIAQQYRLRAVLTHDLAFGVDYSKWLDIKGEGTLNCFRGDVESLVSYKPEDNNDISALAEDSWNPLNCTEAAEMFISTIAKYENINTDRLHVAIVGTLLGKTVKLYQGLWTKNSAVYEYSLKGKPNISLHDPKELVTGIDFRAIVIHQASRMDRKQCVKDLFKDVGNCGVYEAICPVWDTAANRAVRGCTLSHIDIVRKHLNTDIDWLLILEDDAVALPAFKEEFLKLKPEEIPSDCSTLVIGGDCSNVTLSPGKFLKVLPPFWGSHAVLYNLPLIRKTDWVTEALMKVGYYQLGPNGGSNGVCYESIIMMTNITTNTSAYRMRSMSFTTAGGFSARSQTNEPPRSEALTV